MEKYQLHERACLNIVTTSREAVLNQAKSTLGKLFGDKSYGITEVLYDINGPIITATVYAVYVGEPI